MECVEGGGVGGSVRVERGVEEVVNVGGLGARIGCSQRSVGAGQVREDER